MLTASLRSADGVREFTIAELTIRPDACRASLSGHALTLSPGQFDLLFSLARACGRVKTREDLYAECHAREYGAAEFPEFPSGTSTQHFYLRVDGPRCCGEMVAQGAVLYSNQKFVHYHSIYRDKLSDYGGEFGSFLNGASTAGGYTGTTYTRPSFTTQPQSATGASTTFIAAAPANSGSGAVTPAYQWYSSTVGSGTAISGATAATYTITQTTAGSAGGLLRGRDQLRRHHQQRGGHPDLAGTLRRFPGDV